MDYFRSRKKGANSDENKDLIKILLVAVFRPKKGIFDTIKAFAEVSKEIKNIHLDLVGRGMLEDQIKDYITSLELTNKVTITDNQSKPNPRQLVLNFMQNCDIFILPSITSPNGDSEGTPVVLMEASACGNPCITTLHSGNPEVVLHNKTGIVVSEGDVDGLMKCLKELILNKDLRKEFGLNARKHIQNEFNSSISSEKLKRIYKDILE